MDKLLRLLPSFKGKHRLGKLLFSGTIQHSVDITVKGKHDCTYLLPNIKENVGYDIFVNGEYEPEIQDLLKHFLPKGGCLLDLGANIGSILVPLAKARPDVNIVGVEAAPWIFPYLKNNVAINKLDNVILVNKALFNQDNLELDFFSPQDKFGKGSLSPVFTKEGVKVRTVMVDSLVRELGIARIDVIKIDVEGFERFVFDGARQLLQNVEAPVVIFEFVDWAESRAMNLQPGDAQKLLIELGYQLYEIQGHKLLKLKDAITEGSFNLLATKKDPLGVLA